jgi:hypothetical protein
MIIATEDNLSEVVVRKLLGAFRPTVPIVAAVGGRGKSYLQNRAAELNRTAASVPVLLLVDLDTPSPCPAELIARWLPQGLAANMLFRAAVMEVESWLLADRIGFSRLLSIDPRRIPTNTDSVANPKEFLIGLAQKSRNRVVRADLVPADKSSAKVGPGYTSRLAAFVNLSWDPIGACASSGSLQRLVNKLKSAALT